MKIKRFMLALLIISICAFTFTALGNTTYVEASDDSSSYTLQDSIVAEDENTINPNRSTWINAYNCYAFALGKYDTTITDFSPSPSAQKYKGYYVGEPSTGQRVESDDIEDYIDGIVSDLLYWRCTNITISTTMPSTDLDINERLICFRMSTDALISTNNDYHFMRYKIKKDADGNSYGAWYHKPGNTYVLQYKYTPSNDRVWKSENFKNNVTSEGFPYTTSDGQQKLMQYDSPIYYIKYTDPFEYNVLTNRYVIDSYEDLNNIRYFPNKGWEFSASVSIPSTETWEPIENFSGYLEGNGYSISNLKYNGPAIDNLGFVAVNSGIIQNLNIASAEFRITGTIDLNQTINIGTIAAKNYTNITNCNVGSMRIYSEVSISSNTQANVGGICGINGDVSQNMSNTGLINACNVKYFGSSITGSLGGICGVNEKGTITSCMISASSLSIYSGHVGGIAGKNYLKIDECDVIDVTISCYNGYPTTSFMLDYYPEEHFGRAGGIVGENSNSFYNITQASGQIENCSITNVDVMCNSDYVDADHGGRSFAPEMGLFVGRATSNILVNNTYSNSSVSGSNLTTLTWKGGFLNLQTYSWNQAQYIGNRPIGREM